MLNWGGVWYIPHLTGRTFLYHVVYCCSHFYSKLYSSRSLRGIILSQIYDSILYFTTFKKNAEWRQRTISDTDVVTVGNEEVFIKCAILVLNCVLTILNFYFKIVDTLAVKSAFQTCVQEPKVLSLSVFSALVVMYSKWCTIYYGGIDTVLWSWKKNKTSVSQKVCLFLSKRQNIQD